MRHELYIEGEMSNQPTESVIEKYKLIKFR